jgi:recombination protein RecA
MNKVLVRTVQELQERYGENAIMRASEMPRYAPVSCGSLAVDFAVGIGGLPTDRLVEICGEEGTGKTTLALLTMVNCLRDQPDRGALILDLEHKLDFEWLKSLVGADLLEERIIYAQPDHIEQATNIYKAAVATGTICFALLDSIGGAPTVRSNEDATVARFGGNSLGVGEFARTAGTLAAKYRCLTIGINQVRDDMKGYNRVITPGGRAWKFHVVLRILLKRTGEKAIQKINGEDWQIGYEISAKLIKNGLAPPFRVATYWFYNVATDRYGFGIDTLEEIVRLGLVVGVIDRRGGWYHHPCFPDHKGEHKILSKPAMIDYLRDADESIRIGLSAEIVQRLPDHAAEVAPIQPEDPDPEDD